jgi:hypothetical protein
MVRESRGTVIVIEMRSMLRRNKFRIFAFVWGFFFFFPPYQGMAFKDWSMTLYGARLTGDTLASTLELSATYEDSYFLAAALSRKIGTLATSVDFEVEGQVVQHFIEQHHQEFNVLIVGRWLPFPWDKYLDTSFAVGNGISYATKTPEIEAREHDETSQFLNYLMFELAFALPDVPQWDLVVRIHHRSGIFGLINDVEGASNAIGFGIRYNF